MIAALRAKLPSLSEAEAAVARTILQDPASAARASIEDLARASEVSTATVLRTCRSLGYTGYRAFRTSLIADVSRVPAVVVGDVQRDDDPIEIARKVFAADIEAISATLELLDGEALKSAVEILDRAERIEVYGVGSSAPVAIDAYYRLLRIGMRAGVVTDSHMQAVSASTLTETDCAFVFSHTGRTLETIATAKLAREAGAKVVAITSFFDSPLGEHVDALLVAAAAETAFRVEAMSSRVAHLSIVDAIYVALAHRRAKRAQHVLNRTNQIIEEKRIPPRNREP